MNKTVAAVRLMAKAAFFFAQCDKEFHAQERQFVEGFVAGINQMAQMDSELKEKMFVSHVLDETYALDHIVDETREVLELCNERERRIVLYAIDDFVKKIIHADGKVLRQEQMSYETWRREVGLEQLDSENT